MRKMIFSKIFLTILAFLFLISPKQSANANQDDLPLERGWSGFHYVFVAGSTMRPRSSATTWSYPAAGCVSTVSGNDIFTIHLQLPQGSRIDYLRIFYYDTSANNSQAWVTTYNGAGGYQDLVMAGSSGNFGYGSSLSPYVGHVVNNSNNAYVLNYRANQTGATMHLCGLRVAYRVPQQTNVYLPLINK